MCLNGHWCALKVCTYSFLIQIGSIVRQNRSLSNWWKSVHRPSVSRWIPSRRLRILINWKAMHMKTRWIIHMEILPSKCWKTIFFPVLWKYDVRWIFQSLNIIETPHTTGQCTRIKCRVTGKWWPVAVRVIGTNPHITDMQSLSRSSLQGNKCTMSQTASERWPWFSGEQNWWFYNLPEEVGRAQFNLTTSTYATVAYSVRYVPS